MKIINKTDYETRELRKLFRWCMQHEGIEDSRRRTWEVVYSQQQPTWALHLIAATNRCYGYVSGLATYGHAWVKMKLPKCFCNGKTVAQVAIHELGHNLHLRHKEMVYSSEIDVSDLSLEFRRLEAIPKEKPAKAKRDVIAERHRKAAEKLLQWEGKLRSAKRKVQRYKIRVKYYQKKYGARLVALKNEGDGPNDCRNI